MSVAWQSFMSDMPLICIGIDIDLPLCYTFGKCFFCEPIMDKLAKLRKEKMLTQQEVASKAGISITTVSRLENDRVKASLRTIRALAPVFNMSLEEMQELLVEK